jgi:predicted enzyme related to lactoylglutathione lyase
MTVRQNVPDGAPCWVDLQSSDRARSIAFYGGLFGWTAEEADEAFGGYTNLQLDGERVAGLMQHQPGQGGVADVWTVYLAVDDAAAAVQSTRDNGGDVLVDAMPVGALGVMAVVADPTGAVIGMWQPGEHRGGVVATTGAPCHFELHTRDHAGALSFYEKVFGWSAARTSVIDTPELRYAVLEIGDGENAGIMDAGSFLPEGMPAHWEVYFAVDDADAATARAVELGGAVVQPAESTPYGRLASVADSTGALFRLRADG